MGTRTTPLWHERVVLLPLLDHECLVVSPDGEIQMENILIGEESVFEDIRPVKADRTVRGVAARDFYRWEDAQGKAFSSADLDDLKAEAAIILATSSEDWAQ